MSNINLSGTFNIFKLLLNPSLCLPHATVSTFNQIPIPISGAFAQGEKNVQPDIRAIVLDKDNCFATPGSNEVYSDYRVKQTKPSEYSLTVFRPISRLSLNHILLQATVF
jgi:phosphatidylglycerophosphatase GEP4